jgi:small-conductance mechanosensitive channel
MIDFLLTYQNALIAGAAVLILFYLLRAFGIAYLKRISEKTTNDLDDLFVNLLKSLRFIFGITLAAVIAFTFTEIRISSIAWLNAVIILVFTYQIVRATGVLFKYIIRKVGRKGGADSVLGLKTILQLAIWLAGGAFLLSALGYNITSLVAGLGIGGVAVALALQSILSDVFSSFSIYFDKPFIVGDVVSVDGMTGTVERIGMKTTRIRSLGGEEIVMSNKQLTDSSLQNFGQLHRRRVVHHIGFEYGIPSKKLQRFVDDVAHLVDEVQMATFDRCHFQLFGDSALIFELVYWAETPEYAEYVEVEHEVNMRIKDYTEAEKLGMAFPTQTVYVNQ